MVLEKFSNLPVNPGEVWKNKVEETLKRRGYDLNHPTTRRLADQLIENPNAVDRMYWAYTLSQKVGGLPFLLAVTLVSTLGVYFLYRQFVKFFGKHRRKASLEELEEEQEELVKEIENLNEPVRVAKMGTIINTFENLKKLTKKAWFSIEISPRGKTYTIDPRIEQAIRSKNTSLTDYFSLLARPPESNAFGLDRDTLEKLYEEKKKIINEKGLFDRFSSMSTPELVFLIGGSALALAALFAFFKVYAQTKGVKERLGGIERVSRKGRKVKVPVQVEVESDEDNEPTIKTSSLNKNLNLYENLRKEIENDIEFIAQNVTDEDIIFWEKKGNSLLDRFCKMNYEKRSWTLKDVSLWDLFSPTVLKASFALMLLGLGIFAGYWGYRYGSKLKSPRDRTKEKALAEVEESFSFHPPISSLIEPEIVIKQKKKKKNNSGYETEEGEEG
jgi:hypothetical protein